MNTNIESAELSITATVCRQAQLFGATPERDELDTPRRLGRGRRESRPAAFDDVGLRPRHGAIRPSVRTCVCGVFAVISRHAYALRAQCVRHARVCSGEPGQAVTGDPPRMNFLESGPSARTSRQARSDAAAHAPLGLGR